MIYISPRELDKNLPLLDAKVEKYNGKVVPEIKVRLARELNIIDINFNHYQITIEPQDKIIVKDTQEIYIVIRVETDNINCNYWLTVDKMQQFDFLNLTNIYYFYDGSRTGNSMTSFYLQKNKEV